MALPYMSVSVFITWCTGGSESRRRRPSLLYLLTVLFGYTYLLDVQAASQAGGVDRLTDTSKYTGSHKERFDDSGKGKGASGRTDTAQNTGYVGAYKGSGTYDKTHWVVPAQRHSTSCSNTLYSILLTVIRQYIAEYGNDFNSSCARLEWRHMQTAAWRAIMANP